MELCRAGELSIVREKYQEVIADTPGIFSSARWSYGIHPTDALLEEHIRRGELFLLMDQGNIAGMTALSMRQPPEFDPIPWEASVPGDEAAVLSLLCVCPAYRGRSVGREILIKAGELAGKRGRGALRLDVLPSNLPAKKLYERNGFSLRGRQSLWIDPIGEMEFLYYEKLLRGGEKAAP